MNSIRRPRARPRVLSYSFRTLAWVLTREAALNVLVPEEAFSNHRRYWQRWMLRHGTDRVRAKAENYIAWTPRLRFYP
ncbi:MAG: hypothetical protein AUH33_04160 [Chloroflexi bacterium 13_1_40CM_68_21]|nr:MAG: hypothetical protein AUH33_04160 [Chloroflexi bacterium 13_1_40CM_68_21]